MLFRCRFQADYYGLAIFHNSVVCLSQPCSFAKAVEDQPMKMHKATDKAVLFIATNHAAYNIFIPLFLT